MGLKTKNLVRAQKPELFCSYRKFLFVLLYIFETVQAEKGERDERKEGLFILRSWSDALHSYILIILGSLCLFYNVDKFSTMEEEIQNMPFSTERRNS